MYLFIYLNTIKPSLWELVSVSEKTKNNKNK